MKLYNPFKPHLVTDGEVWAVRRLFLVWWYLDFALASWVPSFATDEDCYVSQSKAEKEMRRRPFKHRLRRVEGPKAGEGGKDEA
jgi:hypothetical protein